DIRIGRSGTADQWESGPPPQLVSVRSLSDGIDRATLTWPDGLLRNTWVRVTVKADWNTGLSEPDVFYFGNSVGAVGLAPDGEGTITPSAADYIAARRTSRHLALPTELFDFDRNGVVNVLDLLASRRALVRPTVLSLVLSYASSR